MKKLISAFALVLAFGCQPTEDKTCTVEKVEGESVLVCPDGTTAPLGTGNTDPSCTVTEENGIATITCPDGASTIIANAQELDLQVEDIPVGSEDCPFGGERVTLNDFTFTQNCNSPTANICDVATGRYVVESDQALQLLTGCRVINGDLVISDVTSLEPLSQLEEVVGRLIIGNFHADLSPLSNLEYANNLVISNGYGFENLQGLSGLKYVGQYVLIANNPDLRTAEGFELDYLGIIDSDPETLQSNGLSIVISHNHPDFDICSVADVYADTEVNENYQSFVVGSHVSPTATFWEECQDARPGFIDGQSTYGRDENGQLVFDDPNP